MIFDFNPLRHIFFKSTDAPYYDENPQSVYEEINQQSYNYMVVDDFQSVEGTTLFNVISSSINGGQIELKDNNKNNQLYYPFLNGSDQLCHNGCYHFKLKYNPNAKLDTQFKVGQLKMDTDATQFLKESWSGFWKFVSETNNKFETTKEAFGNELQNIYHAKLAESLKYQIQSSAVDKIYRTENIVSNAFDKPYNEQWKKDNNVQENLYDDNKCYVTDVFLPLNSMTVHRESGVQESDQIMTNDWKTNQLIKATKDAMKQRNTDPITRKAGYGDSKYKGYTMNGYDFENYNFEWELMPRNWEEMNQILQILTVFQCSCISNIDLNDKSNLFWIVPPECDVDIIVTSSDVDENKKRISSKRLNDYNKFFKNVNKKDMLKVKLLKSMKVYIKDVEISPISNSGGVLISDEGFPMGVKLKVTAMRTELMSLRNLQYNKEVTEEKWQSAENYNPFA